MNLSSWKEHGQPNFFPNTIVLCDYDNLMVDNRITADYGRYNLELFARDITARIVSIGSKKPVDGVHYDYALSVDGKIVSKKSIVDIDGWADFVFDENYKLTPLNEVENFINANKHLPDVPSEKEVKDNGLDLGTMDAVLLRKIEELTLYIIQQQKEIEELKQKISKE